MEFSICFVIIFFESFPYSVSKDKKIICNFQEFFVELDEEEDGFIYMKQIVVTLKALNQDIDHNLKVTKSNDLWKSFELRI